MTKLPARFNSIAMPLVLATIMTCIISGVSTYMAIGLPPGFGGRWMSAWATSWMVAFPVLLLVLPIVRRIVGFFVEAPGAMVRPAQAAARTATRDR